VSDYQQATAEALDEAAEELLLQRSALSQRRGRKWDWGLTKH
jgi:hypothetical protein